MRKMLEKPFKMSPSITCKQTPKISFSASFEVF